MKTETNNTNVEFKSYKLSVERSDALVAAETMLSGSSAIESIRAGSKNAGATMSAFLLGMLKSGATAQEFDEFRDEGYALAESHGVTVNRKTNSFAAAISRAKTVVASPVRARAVESGGNLNQVVKAVLEAKKAVEAAEEAETANAARLREDEARAEQHAAAVESGEYAERLLQMLESLVTELAEHGKVVTFKVKAA